MKFIEYQQNTKRTLPNLHSKYIISNTPMVDHLLDLIHMRLGVASEFGELVLAVKKGDKVNIGEELGDALWYIANDLTICKKTGFISPEEFNKFAVIEFGEPMATNGGFMLDGNDIAWLPSLVYNIGELIDFVKKALAYGKPMNSADYVKHMQYLLGAINNCARDLDINLEEYMEKNINKLKGRFPEKFSEEKANNRDLDKERQILEGKA